MRTGLYNPGDFKDNCGFGLLAHLEGEQSHELLVTAIKSLTFGNEFAPAAPLTPPER